MQPDNNLSRFTRAQKDIYSTALTELRSGHKQSHWMWFIFPQIDGLGRSNTARYYAIKNQQEALQYLNNPILGPHLIECTETVLAVEDRNIAQIFGYPDEMKFKSSMTLYAAVESPGSVFELALDKYFYGERDSKTLALLDRLLPDEDGSL